jgi:hypothetical protein
VPYVRTVRTASGAIAVQIVYSYHRGSRQIEHIAAVLEGLRARGMRTAFLWVLDGNEVAMRLYQRAGFMSTNHRQPLVARPGRTEERLYLNLDLSEAAHRTAAGMTAERQP